MSGVKPRHPKTSVFSTHLLSGVIKLGWVACKQRFLQNHLQIVDFPFPCLITRGQEYCPFGKKMRYTLCYHLAVGGFSWAKPILFQKTDWWKKDIYHIQPKECWKHLGFRRAYPVHSHSKVCSSFVPICSYVFCPCQPEIRALTRPMFNSKPRIKTLYTLVTLVHLLQIWL